MRMRKVIEGALGDAAANGGSSRVLATRLRGLPVLGPVMLQPTLRRVHQFCYFDNGLSVPSWQHASL